MADEPEDPDAAADRLEAALERIASLASAKLSVPVPEPLASDSSASEPTDDTLSVPEIAERLDHLIGRLRAALGIDPGDNQEVGSKTD